MWRGGLLEENRSSLRTGASCAITSLTHTPEVMWCESVTPSGRTELIVHDARDHLYVEGDKRGEADLAG